MTEQEVVHKLTGMLEEIKRKAGPSIGLVRKFWPRADTLRREIERLYERAKWCQEEVARL